jgi:hypothetical protein
MAAQFKSLVMLLTDKRFNGNDGTCSTDGRVRLELQLIVPQPTTICVDPSASFTLFFY